MKRLSIKRFSRSDCNRGWTPRQSHNMLGGITCPIWPEDVFGFPQEEPEKKYVIPQYSSKRDLWWSALKRSLKPHYERVVAEIKPP